MSLKDCGDVDVDEAGESTDTEEEDEDEDDDELDKEEEIGEDEDMDWSRLVKFSSCRFRFLLFDDVLDDADDVDELPNRLVEI